MPRRLAAILAAAALVMTGGCTIEQRCREDRDCSGVQVCDTASGSCVYECETDDQCDGFSFVCEDHSCRFHCDDGELACPAGMVAVCSAYCIDTYEASRPDATAAWGGADESAPVSQPGVIPWYDGVLTSAEAAAACESAGKQLCTPLQWEAACSGGTGSVYCYGETYDPLTCNGIDSWCDPDCGIYPWCYQDCEANEQVVPTGTYEDCTSAFDAFDLSGNVWEAVATDDGIDHFRGGAYNCGDPGLAHTCAYDGVAAGTFPSARGFRCCSDGTTP